MGEIPSIRNVLRVLSTGLMEGWLVDPQTRRRAVLFLLTDLLGCSYDIMFKDGVSVIL